MYDALDEIELPDLPSGRFIADDHGSQWIEWVDPRPIYVMPWRRPPYLFVPINKKPKIRSSTKSCGHYTELPRVLIMNAYYRYEG